MTTCPQSISIRVVLTQFDIDAPDISVDDLVLDSREVGVHSAFVAVIGHKLDGRDFIPQAVSLGARVILAETQEQSEHGELSMREQTVIIAFYQLNQRLSELSAAFYQHPAEGMKVVAVTGTNGKTSSVNLVAQLAQLSGYKSASIGTLGVQTYAQEESAAESSETVNTTPDAVSLQRILSKLKQQGVKLVAMEASSHALVQGRLAALKTDVAVFTNLTRDHLDYHGDMGSYAAAKRSLLQQPGLAKAVLNYDDAETKNWLTALSNSVDAVLFSIDNQGVKETGHKYCLAQNVSYTSNGCEFLLQSSWGQTQIRIPLLGHFNVANLLTALASLLSLGTDIAQLALFCRQLKPVTGRMQMFTNPAGANVIVDYAHTPDALAQTLKALRLHCHQQLWCIFGCGGDRDQGKRPLMGRIGEQQADHLILTNDNSRTEAPRKIIEDILSGCANPDSIHVELNRKRAIRWALNKAKQDDLVLVAGKGHENYQIIGEQRLQYDERAFVKTLLGGV